MTNARPRFDLDALRAEFPILDSEANGKPLAYLDNAVTRASVAMHSAEWEIDALVCGLRRVRAILG